MSDDEAFGEELRREWFAGRAGQIHSELQADFHRHRETFHMARVRQLLAVTGQSEDDPVSLAAANTTATAEGIIAAVAVYLARQELKTDAG